MCSWVVAWQCAVGLLLGSVQLGCCYAVCSWVVAKHCAVGLLLVSVLPSNNPTAHCQATTQLHTDKQQPNCTVLSNNPTAHCIATTQLHTAKQQPNCTLPSSNPTAHSWVVAWQCAVGLLLSRVQLGCCLAVCSWVVAWQCAVGLLLCSVQLGCC